jgi:uncharacterized protein YaaQ
MKIILAVIRDSDEAQVVEEMVKLGIRVTRMAGTGGFLRRGNVTLMIGVEEEKLTTVMDLIKKTCTLAEGFENRAVIFVLNAIDFKKV